jgi:hypothetical protein
VPIIHNDRQVYRVVITKSFPPKQNLGLGHVLILRMLLFCQAASGRGDNLPIVELLSGVRQEE